MDRAKRRALFSWASVSLLAGLCAVVAILQYRWIGEISGAERQRLQEQLRAGLDSIRQKFNEDISSAASALEPDALQLEAYDRETAYALRYDQWKRTHKPIFQRIALAVRKDQDVILENLDLDTGQFSVIDWPQEWAALHERIDSRMEGRPVGPAGPQFASIIEMPRFTQPQPGGPRDMEWLLLQLNLDYVSGTLFPQLLDHYLGRSARVDYAAEVVVNATPSTVIYHSSPVSHEWISQKADASVMLLQGDLNFPRGPGAPPEGGFRGNPFERGFGRSGFGFRGNLSGGPNRREGREGRGGRRFFRDGQPRGGPDDRNFRGGPPGPQMIRAIAEGPGWQLLLRHKAGSLEALVERARYRNLAVSGGLLLLILATVIVLVRSSREAQRLAELQMNFVAGVSHELRTPLTVIRTAAFNLRGRLATRPEQVEKYGLLIQNESEKLQALVEQVLRFVSARAGLAVRQREPVNIQSVIERSLQASDASLRREGLMLEKHVEPDLPLVLGDQLAMQHAIQNLIENALKYGAEGSNWIGIFAAPVSDSKGHRVEIRVADRGPGIPSDEQDQIFDAFFRGRRAVEDQIHGTGLGLSLVKNIVEEHGGTIQLHSAPGKGAEFVIQLPVAPAASTEIAQPVTT